RLGLHALIRVVFENRAMQVVRAAFGLYVDSRASRQSLLGIEAVGHYVDGLDGFERRHIGHDVGELDHGRTRAVDTSIIRAAARPVHVEGQGVGWIRRYRLCVLRT